MIYLYLAVFNWNSFTSFVRFDWFFFFGRCCCGGESYRRWIHWRDLNNFRFYVKCSGNNACFMLIFREIDIILYTVLFDNWRFKIPSWFIEMRSSKLYVFLLNINENRRQRWATNRIFNVFDKPIDFHFHFYFNIENEILLIINSKTNRRICSGIATNHLFPFHLQ